MFKCGGFNSAPTLTTPSVTTSLTVTKTDNSGTPGNTTISTPAGKCAIAAAASAVTVTSSICTAASIVLCQVISNDATAKSVSCVPGAGSFTITANAAATAATTIGFLVIN